MQAKIGKRVVDAAKPGARDSFIWDNEVKGFGLKITPAGKRIYVLQVRLGGRLRRHTIGIHGSPWTPDGARDEAIRLRGLVASGIDPAADKERAKGDLSITQLCDLYCREGCGTKKAATIAVEGGLIERHIKPLLGRRRLGELSRTDVERFLADVAAGKTAKDERTKKRGRAIVRGGKGTANRTLDLLASMLAFAERRSLRPDNPARGVKKFRSQPRERFLSVAEIAKLGEVLAAAEAEHRAAMERRAQGLPVKSGRKGEGDLEDGENPYAVAAIRLLMLTGCRKSEILSLRWDWVDFERAMLRLPDSKTGAKTVPLAAPALELLERLPRVEGNPHVFPSGTGDGHYVGLQKVWARLRARAGLDGVRIHDLRHSFASVGVSAGDSLYVVGKLLGHTQARTTQRYAHLSDDPLRSAVDRIAARISCAMNGGEAGEVVPLKRGAG